MCVVKVEGKIQGKGRPRFFGGHAVTPQNTVIYENLIKTCYTNQCGKLHEREVRIDIWAYFAIPQSYSKKVRQACELNAIKPTKKPDIDNITKAVLDGLNGVAYMDDKQVTTICVRKRYTVSNECLAILVNDEFEVSSESSKTC